MTKKVLRIERIKPPGSIEAPFVTNGRFKLADPKFGEDRHTAKHAKYVDTLEEAAAGVENGLLLWMKEPGKRQTLIRPASLRIVYA